MQASSKIAQMLFEGIVNSTPAEGEIPVYCVIRKASSHNECDNVLAVCFDEAKANKKKQELIAKLPARSKHKVYVQISILGK